MKKEPMIKVSQGGDNFNIIDSEIIGDNRPALETEALNTQIIQTTFLNKKLNKKWTTEILLGVVVLIIGTFIINLLHTFGIFPF